MTARDVVPQPVEQRSFLRRRRTDEPHLERPAPPAVAAPVPIVEPPPVEPARTTESDDLLRAKDSLLQAALRQCDELSTALLNEQHLRQQEIERLTAENQLLRDALTKLNAEALERQQLEGPAPAMGRISVVLPEPRDHGSRADAEPLRRDVQRNARRRSARQAGPA